MTKKIIIALIVVIVLIVLAVLLFQTKELPEEIIPPKPTGNVEDLKEALSQELVDMESVLLEESEADLIISDSELLDDFGQSINEDEL